MPKTASKSEHHRLQEFVGFLVAKGVLASDVIAKLVQLRSRMNFRIGEVAMMKQLLTPEQTWSIVAQQVDTAKKFGEIAEESGLLQPAQIEKIIKLQGDPLQILLFCMALTKVAPIEELRKWVREFSDRPTPEKKTKVPEMHRLIF